MKKLLCILTSALLVITTSGLVAFGSGVSDNVHKKSDRVLKLEKNLKEIAEKKELREKFDTLKETIKEKAKEKLSEQRSLFEKLKEKLNQGKQISTINKVYNQEKKEIVRDMKELRELWKESVKDSANKSVYKMTYKEDFQNQLNILREELKNNKEAKKEAKLELIRDISLLRKAIDDKTIPVFVNGQEVKFDDVPPIIKNGRTLIPVRAVVAAMNAKVDWNEKESKVTIKKDDVTIVLVINKIEILVNGKPVVLDVPAQIHNKRTVLPIRAIMEAFSKKVDWDKESDSVLID
jgi:hypothetical protein